MNVGNTTRSRSFRWLICCLLPVLLAADLPKEAAQKLRDGLRLFRDSQFAEAETAFAEASELAPESITIIFDEACAARANGDADQARALFLKSAQSREADLSMNSHYNLGCLEADAAREKLGEGPGAAEGDVRTESINLLLTAVRHYRDVLRLRPHHGDARHNLELIRVFIKHIQSEWAERDKQKERDEKDLLQFLMMIEERQDILRGTAGVLLKEEESASKRNATRAIVDMQSTLQEEIEYLKQKISEQLQQSQQQPAGAVKATGPDDQQVEKLLHQLSDEAGTGMLAAANALAAADFEAAEEAQIETLNQLNQLYMAIAPYQNILQRSVQDQSALVPEERLPTEVSVDGEAQDEEPTAAAEAPKDVDFVKSRETQSRITDWSRMLSLKAEAELPQVQQQLEAIPPDPEPAAAAEPVATEVAPVEAAPSEAAPSDTDAPAEPELTEEQQQRKQLQGLVKSMELAIKLGPDAEEHSQAAAQALMAEDQPKATPEQQETLRIMKEIAEPLVKDQQDQNDQQQDQDPQDGDQKNEDQPQQDEKQDQSDQKKPEPGDEQQEKESEQQRQKESQKQQAESVLRQARDREREYRELEKQRNAIMLRGIKVDKDW